MKKMGKIDLLGYMLTEFPINAAIILCYSLIAVIEVLRGFLNKNEEIFIGIILFIISFIFFKLFIKYANWHSKILEQSLPLINKNDLEIEKIENNLKDFQEYKVKLVNEYKKENRVLRIFVKNIYSLNLEMLIFSIDTLNLRKIKFMENK